MELNLKQVDVEKERNSAYEYFKPPDMEKFTLEKLKVCAICESPHVVDIDCVCTYSDKYPTIELEFSRCNCCNKTESFPANTEFNNKQRKEYYGSKTT